MAKILCIDDTPKEILDSGKSLQEILNALYKDTYKVIFKKTGKEGVETASSDKDIKLVLLDIDFKGKAEGPQIADNLKVNAPHVKVIVLTKVDNTGKRISFGWKPNVVHYVVKKELSSSEMQRRLKNLSQAVIEDYGNKGWKLEYDGKETITMSKGAKSFGINIPITAKYAIQDCIISPNKPVTVSLPSDKLNKAHNMINNNVREGTDWNTWGILTKEGCAKGQLKLVIGSAVGAPSASPAAKDPYVTQSQFEKFKREIEGFKNEIMAELEKIKV